MTINLDSTPQASLRTAQSQLDDRGLSLQEALARLEVAETRVRGMEAGDFGEAVEAMEAKLMDALADAEGKALGAQHEKALLQAELAQIMQERADAEVLAGGSPNHNNNKSESLASLVEEEEASARDLEAVGDAYSKALHWEQVAAEKHEKKEKAFSLSQHWKKVADQRKTAAKAAAKAVGDAVAADDKADQGIEMASLTAAAEAALQAVEEAEVQVIQAQEDHKKQAAEAESATEEKRRADEAHAKEVAAAGAYTTALHWENVATDRYERKEKAFSLSQHWKKVSEERKTAAAAAAKAADDSPTSPSSNKKAKSKAKKKKASLAAEADAAQQASEEADAERVKAEEQHKKQVVEAEAAVEQKRLAEEAHANEVAAAQGAALDAFSSLHRPPADGASEEIPRGVAKALGLMADWHDESKARAYTANPLSVSSPATSAPPHPLEADSSSPLPENPTSLSSLQAERTRLSAQIDVLNIELAAARREEHIAQSWAREQQEKIERLQSELRQGLRLSLQATGDTVPASLSAQADDATHHPRGPQGTVPAAGSTTVAGSSGGPDSIFKIEMDLANATAAAARLTERERPDAACAVSAVERLAAPASAVFTRVAWQGVRVCRSAAEAGDAGQAALKHLLAQATVLEAALLALDETPDWDKDMTQARATGDAVSESPTATQLPRLRETSKPDGWEGEALERLGVELSSVRDDVTSLNPSSDHQQVNSRYYVITM